MLGGLLQALPATRKSTRGGVLEYLLAVSCAGLCQRCNYRVDACPLSDLVVVNFPGYAGPRCFDNLPNTWVPVTISIVAPSLVGPHQDLFGSVIIIIISAAMSTASIIILFIIIAISIILISSYFGFSVYRTVNRNTCAQVWGSELRRRWASGHPLVRSCKRRSLRKGAERLRSPTQ